MVEWSAPEFEHRPKSIAWYWASIALAVFFIAAAAWQKNFLFGFFLLVAEVLVIVWGNRSPAAIAFRLNEKGIALGEKTFRPISDFESFSVNERWSAEWPSVTLYFKKRFRPAMRMHVPGALLDRVDETLRGMIPKIEHEDTLIETLEYFLGF